MIEFISRLPQGYQEVEYIESSGTQYIDEEFRPSGENVRILTDYMYLSSPNGKSLFGAQTTDTTVTFPITCYHTSNTVSSFYVGSSQNIIDYTVAIDVRYLLDCHANNGAFTADLNGDKQTATYSGSLAKTLNIFMFTNDGQQGTQTIAARLYARKIWDNDELVRDYVPCYRKADNVAGLYDLVTDTFLVNVGSGTFAVGNNSNKRGEWVITVGGIIPIQYALRRRMMIKCDSKIELEYTGNYTDNRDETGIGTVRFTSSGTLTVLSGKATVSAYVLGAGGGGAFYARSESHLYHASGGGGGYQTVEVELTPGTYDVVIGVGGAGKASKGQASSGGDTTAFGTVSTGGKGGYTAYPGSAGGTGGTPNGNSGSFVDINYATEIAGGSPNGGKATQWASKNKGGDGYVEITFS